MNSSYPNSLKEKDIIFPKMWHFCAPILLVFSTVREIIYVHINFAPFWVLCDIQHKPQNTQKTPKNPRFHKN